MTEREKCDAGLMYDTSFPGRDEDNLKCLDLCWEFNHMKPSLLKERMEIIYKMFARLGKNARVEPNIFVSFGYNIEAGDNLFINHDCVFLDPGKITFGNNVYIGPQCGFYTAHHNVHSYWRNQGYEYAFPITIGDNVWIGGGSMFMPGAKVGSNVVIGGGSVVTGEIPDNVIAFGNPCRVYRAITEQDILDRT